MIHLKCTSSKWFPAKREAKAGRKIWTNTLVTIQSLPVDTWNIFTCPLVWQTTRNPCNRNNNLLQITIVKDRSCLPLIFCLPNPKIVWLFLQKYFRFCLSKIYIFTNLLLYTWYVSVEDEILQETMCTRLLSSSSWNLPILMWHWVQNSWFTFFH